MSTLTLPEPLVARIEEALRESGEVDLVRGGHVVARILRPAPARPIPPRTALRATLPRLATPSEDLVRRDRDGA